MQPPSSPLEPPQLGPLGAALAAAFRRRGFPMHKCTSPGYDGENHVTGGLCLVEEPNGAVLIRWARGHDLARVEGVDEDIETLHDMLDLFRHWLQRWHFPYESGPAANSVRVLGTPSPDHVPAEWVTTH